MCERMNKKMIVFASVLLMAICIVGVFVMQSTKIVGEEGLIAKARKEINNAEAETIDMVIAGKSTLTRNQKTVHLFWFVTGNEYQANTPYPIEFVDLGNEEYEFVHSYNPIPRGQDCYALLWHSGYSFFVNNPKCKTIKIYDYAGVKEIEVTEYPFVCQNNLLPGDYLFLDENGNEIR